jgi:hypothetical protein
MKFKSKRLKLCLFALLFIPTISKSQEYGHFGVGVQRAIWTLWGPSAIIDLNRRIGFETIIGIDFFSNTNSNLGAFERVIIRPLTYKTNSLYLAGMVGVAHWHFLGSYHGDYIEAYEWGLHWGIMGGAELDSRLLFPRCIPLFINIEGGMEHRETKYTTSNTYPTYGFGIHYRF